VGGEIKYLAHESNSDAASVVVNFGYPVKEAAFVLRAEPEVAGTLTAFDSLGNNLGSIPFSGLDPNFGEFTGFSTANTNGVSKVIVDYGSSSRPEEIVAMYVVGSTQRSFTTYLAQVADGKVGVRALRTTVVIANLSNTTAAGEYRIIGDDGTPLEFELADGKKTSGEDFVLDGFSSLKWATTGTTTTPVQGYVVIESDSPVTGTAIFQLVDADGLPLSEAGVGGATARNLLIGAVSKLKDQSFDSGVAVANPNDTSSSGVIELVSQSGEIDASNNTFLQMDPGEHKAAFLPTLFPGVENFEGTLVIRSPQRLAVVILRTRQGLVLSSLPLGSTQK
jgi:hypothetical protein